MKKDRALHTTLATIEPPHGLYETIMLRIDAAARRAAKMRTALFGVLAFASAAALVPVVEYTIDQLYKSGFDEYFSLLLSDHSLALTYWREFGLSLLESLPSIALLLLLPIAAALLWSLSRLIKNARSGFIYA